ncbi:glycoside hydrolase family 3 C-terminal domain-containing protein [Novosphingobium sp. MMS21-SN21R]|uniref:glycoside hydrolase family 3 C-terminal domain-containing protein n=1 Tax=Novosphingobium sp. MMS21-SN21R TaxID=2969298 RepID=UPI002886DB2C|nr:glycoside hydrolase family 3 C-terminal domain-containing protein [Novosphingobium sp. MMS21-SN21R]MDT0509753.1 glycoside hydrolase family 3 C-terminal domain-containing protein [Novosphingobium sp. MMS21-SN21R]
MRNPSSIASLTVATALALCLTAPAFAKPAATPEQQAAAIVAQMTLEEKASQLINSQPAIPRLNLPDYQWWSEALHGFAFNPHATNFPEPVGLAASFNAPLLKQIAEAISVEGIEASDAMVAAGTPLELGAGRTYWSPNLNIFRDPRWGRGQETYGEDPFLTGKMGVAYVTGLQGPNPDAPKIVATPKHFAVHSGPESTRHTANVNVSVHDMRDTYLPAFRAALVDGHAGSVMCAYSAINGQPACANTFLMQETLRKDWGFTGAVVSDCGAVRDISSAHKFAPDIVEGSALAVRAGLDIECATESLFDRNSFGQSDNYVKAVKTGKLAEADLDRAVARGLTTRIRLGLVDGKSARPALATSSINTPEHRALALAAAEQTLVLLKNDGVLPLDRKGVKIALVGPLADSRRVLRGNYTSRETADLPSVLDGMKAALPDAQITFVPAGESVSDGNVIPTSALLSEDGKPGVTMRYYPFKPDGKPAPTTLMDKFMRAFTATPAETPTTTRIEPLVSSELFTQPQLPDGGKAVASGFIVAPETGTYRIGARTIAGTFEFADKPKVEIKNGFNPAVMPVFQTVDLVAGQRYPFTFAVQVPALHFGELNWQRVSRQPEADLAAGANNADVIVAVVGINSTLESEESSIKLPGFNGGDRTSLDLPADQIALLKAAKATGKPLVVINMSGSAINLEWAKENASAIIQAWYPGEAGGLAVGRAVAGLANPAGRLPVTFYRDVTQLPAFEDFAMKDRTYRYFEGKPVYAFGHGLSYTKFAYAPVKVRLRDQTGAMGAVVETEVTNVGRRSGDEVAQLYLNFPAAPGTPKVALRGFQRISMAPGEKRSLRFELSPRDLSSVSPEGQTQVLAGNYTISVGGGQPGDQLPTRSITFAIKTTSKLPN